MRFVSTSVSEIHQPQPGFGNTTYALDYDNSYTTTDILGRAYAHHDRQLDQEKYDRRDARMIYGFVGVSAAALIGIGIGVDYLHAVKTTRADEPLRHTAAGVIHDSVCETYAAGIGALEKITQYDIPRPYDPKEPRVFSEATSTFEYSFCAQ